MLRDLVRRRLCLVRKIKLGVLASVTFATGFTMSLQKNVPRKSSLRCHAVMFNPASAPVRRSGFKNALLEVSTLPTRKVRYNSLRVGARKARYIEAVKDKC